MRVSKCPELLIPLYIGYLKQQHILWSANFWILFTLVYNSIFWMSPFYLTFSEPRYVGPLIYAQFIYWTYKLTWNDSNALGKYGYTKLSL